MWLVLAAFTSLQVKFEGLLAETPQRVVRRSPLGTPLKSSKFMTQRCLAIAMCEINVKPGVERSGAAHPVCAECFPVRRYGGVWRHDGGVDPER